MEIKPTKIYLIVFYLLLVTQVYAQGKQRQNVKKSNGFFQDGLVAYKQGNYKFAEGLVFDAIRWDSSNVSAYMLLSDIADEKRNINQRKWALEKIVNSGKSFNPLVYKFLAEIYFNEGNYVDSKNQWSNYTDYGVGIDTVHVNVALYACIVADQMLNKPDLIEIEHLDSAINTSLNEYWPVISADDSTLFFTRLVRKQRFAYERLFFSNRRDSEWDQSIEMYLSSDTQVNEGTMCMTANGNLIFFTACGRPDGKGSCDLYYMRRYDGKWTRPQNVGEPVNSFAWEAQPSVSAFGDMLYFSSNRSGGLGQKDIWCATIDVGFDGLIFGEPINLGPQVNTAKNDFSPFVHADDETLYFASDGHFGLGQSDLFMAQFKDSSWTDVRHLGYPINSNRSDHGLVVSPTGQVVLLSSSREGSLGGSEDIYQLELIDKYKPKPVGYVKGFVYDKSTGQKLSAEIEVNDLSAGKKYLLESTDEMGYIFTLKSNQMYAFNVSFPGYLFYSENFNFEHAESFSKATIRNIYLTPITPNLQLVLNNVFFDFDSHELNKLSYSELNKVVEFLTVNESVIIELSGHTDNQGNEDYNLSLSLKRAEAIKEYLAIKVDASRIKVKGLGSSKPIESNDNEAGRAKNRRTELRIISN